MTVSNGNDLYCSAKCIYCENVGTLDGVYTCGHPESDHQAHVFTDNHIACNEIVYGKVQ